MTMRYRETVSRGVADHVSSFVAREAHLVCMASLMKRTLSV
jgi:hypothetical protein